MLECGIGNLPNAVLAALKDRRGLRESIIGRMDRHGGRAVVGIGYPEPCHHVAVGAVLWLDMARIVSGKLRLHIQPMSLVGIVQAVRQYSWADNLLTVVALFFYSMPSFWLALMLMMIFRLLVIIILTVMMPAAASGLSTIVRSMLLPRAKARKTLLPCARFGTAFPATQAGRCSVCGGSAVR